MKKIFFSLAILSVFVICSCATTKKDLKIVPSKTPDWVNVQKDFWQDNNNYYFKSVTEGKNNIEQLEQIAIAQTRTKIAQTIKNEIKTEFKTISQTLEDMETAQVIISVFNSTVDGVIITGVSVKDSYIENINIKGSISCRYYLLMQISKQDYDISAQKAFNETNDTIDNKYKETLKEIETDFFKK